MEASWTCAPTRNLAVFNSKVGRRRRYKEEILREREAREKEERAEKQEEKEKEKEKAEPPLLLQIPQETPSPVRSRVHTHSDQHAGRGCCCCCCCCLSSLTPRPRSPAAAAECCGLFLRLLTSKANSLLFSLLAWATNLILFFSSLSLVCGYMEDYIVVVVCGSP